MRNKKKNKYVLLLILLLAVTIGYAALATTLKINGTATIAKNSWNVHWDDTDVNIKVTDGSVTNEKPEVTKEGQDPDKSLVSFEVTLNLPGDFYEFEIDAVNEGTIDAMITGIESKIGNSFIKKTVNGEVEVTTPSPLPSYIDYTITYVDGKPVELNHLLVKETGRETYKVRVAINDNINPEDLPQEDDDPVSYEFSFKIDYSQADDNAVIRPGWRLPSGKTASTLEFGDEICNGDQCFNFIKYDGNDVVMLSKYNLKVGAIFDSNADPQYIGEYTSSDPGYALQSSEVRGWIDGESIRRGTVVFSTANYWSGASSYPVDVYDSENHAAQPDPSSSGFPTNQNYSLAYYVEQYKTKLTNKYYATIKDARLLTYQEATDSSIGCSTTSWRCPTSGTGAFITNTSFWVGSAESDEYIWMIDSNGDFYSDYWDYEDGVRPVIVVEKNNL